MLNWLDFLQIAIIVFATYVFYVSFIKNTSSEKLVRGLFGLGLLWGLSFILPWMHLYLLGRFLHWIALFLSVALIVIFQPELRKFLALMGNIKGFKNVVFAFKQDVQGKEKIQKSVDELIKAVSYMSEKHTGALIVFAKDIEDVNIERFGTKINAIISSELLLTLFFNKTPLHDGAVIISENEIKYAGAILPLSQNQLQWKYGTRHRAAIGMTENSNTIVLVVSEETGDISIAEKGNIKKYDDIKKLKTKIEKTMIN
ncbi:MAG: diadenylate cyclase CdaA [Alphaproteobacteria bacterium]|nr:diadenylate cyclase CdaA [Alphaproteobacteria bacterium]